MLRIRLILHLLNVTLIFTTIMLAEACVTDLTDPIFGRKEYAST